MVVVMVVVMVVAQWKPLGGRMDVLNGRGNGEVGWDCLHDLRHGLQLESVGPDQGFLLLLEGPVSFVHGAELVASAPHSVSPHSLQFHADSEALLKPAVGAAFPLGLVYLTALILYTCVTFVVLHRSLEEALTALTGQ